MKINYSQILKKNMLNILKDVLKEIEKNGLQDGHHLYITFKTGVNKVVIPKWLKEKFPEEMTIVIQYEYWNFKVSKNSFNICLSFNDTKGNLTIPYESVISFTDPFANFGIKLIQEELKDFKKTNKRKRNNATKKSFAQDNVVDFNRYKKN